MVRNDYYTEIAQFMSFMDGIEYPRNDNSHVFPQERLLLEITDLDVVSYFNFKACHNTNPSPSDQPIYCRSSTLEYKKKAISSFLPRQNMPWDDITQKGNPTRSRAVHHMIQKVKVHEVRGMGVQSNARRAVEWEEFVNVLVVVRKIYSESKKYSMLMALSVLTLQWQLIGHIDDIMQLRTSTVLFNVRDSFTLHINMSWSKNIRTEMQLPTQILLAAMDPIICPLLNLAVFIETFGGHGGLMFDRAKKTTTNLIDERVLALPLLWAAYEREAPVSSAQCMLIPIRLAEESKVNGFMRVVSLMSTQSKKLGWPWCRIVNRCALSPFALIATTMMGMKGLLRWRSQGGG
jgi:hypothetical protein